MPARPNVVLVVLDTVRARNTSLHGYKRQTTPFLEDFSTESTWYTQARAPGTHSMASHVSLFTNLHVEEHNAVGYTDNIDINETIWKALAEEYGYSTGLFSSNAIVSESSNLSDAFDTQESTRYNPFVNEDSIPFGTAYDPRSTQHLGPKHHLKQSLDNTATVKSLANCGYLFCHNRLKRLFESIAEDYKLIPGKRYVEEFLDWEARTTEPWAACLNLMDAHGPFEPEEEFDQWSDSERKNYDLYDGCIRQADQYVKELVEQLKQRSVYDDTLIIVTSDHGTGWGKEYEETSNLYPEIPLDGKDKGLHEVLTHVPLLVKYPGQNEGRRVDEVATLTNIPKLIQSVLRGEETDPLIDDEYVISSTFRIDEEKARTTESTEYDIEKCIGPWRAVYENTDEGVRKHLVRHGDSIVVDVPDAHTTTVVDRDNEETKDKVKTIFSEMTETDIADGTNDISSELEDHLNDLGYIVD